MLERPFRGSVGHLVDAQGETGDTILISERTKDLLDDPPELVERPDVALKGKSESTALYGVVR